MPCRASSAATKPLAFISSTKVERHAAAAGPRPLGMPIACWMTMKRPSSKRKPPRRLASASSCCLTPAAISLLLDEGIDDRRRGGCADDRGVLQLAGQEQIVGAALAHDDALACPIHFLVGTDRRPVADEITALDEHIRRGERYACATQRIDGKETDVRLPVRHRLHRLACGIENHELDAHAEALRQCAGQVDRHAARCPRGRVGARQNRIAEIDRCTQRSGGREGRPDVIGGGHWGTLRPAAGPARREWAPADGRAGLMQSPVASPSSGSME
jgi:hypothetical protein